MIVFTSCSSSRSISTGNVPILGYLTLARSKEAKKGYFCWADLTFIHLYSWPLLLPFSSLPHVFFIGDGILMGWQQLRRRPRWLLWILWWWVPTLLSFIIMTTKSKNGYFDVVETCVYMVELYETSRCHSHINS